MRNHRDILVDLKDDPLLLKDRKALRGDAYGVISDRQNRNGEVAVFIRNDLPSFVEATLAPGIGAPVGSNTEPTILPVGPTARD
jgi:hypothetical protein